MGTAVKKRSTRKPVAKKPRVEREVSASYDAAKTTTENRKHWKNADNKPPPLANDPHTRMILRMRAQYEVDNNPYCSGMVTSLARDTIGSTPPALQVQTEDKDFNKFVEDKWNEWSTSLLVNLAEKLNIADQGRRIQGENFVAIKQDKEVLKRFGLNLGIDVLSASRVCDSTWSTGQVKNGLYNDDGVYVDVKTGRPRYYTVTDPNAELVYGGSSVLNPGATVDARYLLQWYCPRRAGQFRGVCEITPSLPLFAQLRRYDLATLTAAETAALLAGIMKTNSTLASVEPQAVPNWQKVELERGTLLTLPDGWDAIQFKPEQPVSVYEMFVNCFLRQIGRCLNIPFGVMVGDSSRYNYSSARLDYIGYDAQLDYERLQLIIRILDPIFDEFILELALLYPKVMAKLVNNTLPHKWEFAKRPSIDPQKDAQTSTERISNGTSNQAIECAKDGNNWEDVQDQRITEMKAWKDKLSKNGLTENDNSGNINGDKTSTGVDSNKPVPANTDSNTNVDTEGNNATEQIAANPDANVQATALNGAQVASLMAIIDNAISKNYSAKTASLLILLAFPLMDKKIVEELVQEAFSYQPPVKETPENVPENTPAISA